MRLRILALFLLLSLGACVQKTYKRIVVYTIQVDTKEPIEQVGIRGGDKPLNWNEDFLLKADSLPGRYRGVVSYQTGYLFTEVKFTVNGAFELQNGPNRRVEFSKGDTTFYNVTFNVIP